MAAMGEAGVDGNIGDMLGKLKFNSKGHEDRYHLAHVLPLHNLEDPWPEKHLRERIWRSVAGARERCKHEWMRKALDRLILNMD
ncbi:nudix hydrolase 17, mitochondrial-like [Nymphaea colorata]|uniref:nudix hydrolase 17, mitochondrial-like n=1 Tax=Nymphaea colorata TaxID=210225 RepID=UPI00129E87D0|nr:nudix hydrolase 17, mitochondrial-like [Nymphaea colorata]